MKDDANRFPSIGATVYEGHRAEVQLRRMGLGTGSASLVAAIAAGTSGARAAMGAHYPVTYSGMRMWGEGHSELCHQVAPFAFTPRCINGVDLVANDETGVALIVTSGVRVGRRDVPNPSVRYPRKAMVSLLVNRQLSFFDTGASDLWAVWFLLHEVTATSVHAELSRPQEILKDGSVNGWPERILLPAGGPLDGPGLRRTENSPVAPPDIAVRRRAS